MALVITASAPPTATDEASLKAAVATTAAVSPEDLKGFAIDCTAGQRRLATPLQEPQRPYRQLSARNSSNSSIYNSNSNSSSYNSNSNSSSYNSNSNSSSSSSSSSNSNSSSYNRNSNSSSSNSSAAAYEWAVSFTVVASLAAVGPNASTPAAFAATLAAGLAANSFAALVAAAVPGATVDSRSITAVAASRRPSPAPSLHPQPAPTAAPAPQPTAAPAPQPTAARGGDDADDTDDGAATASLGAYLLLGMGCLLGAGVVAYLVRSGTQQTKKSTTEPAEAPTDAAGGKGGNRARFKLSSFGFVRRNRGAGIEGAEPTLQLEDEGLELGARGVASPESFSEADVFGGGADQVALHTTYLFGVFKRKKKCCCCALACASL
jgi:hypothetical protein